MRNKRVVFAFFIILASASSVCLLQCKKTCTAGSGGEVTLVLTPQHHGKAIPSTAIHPDSAFIKFNSTDFPGVNPGSYNMVIAGHPGDVFINAPGLKCGQYYIYMTGFDTTINQRVTGGIPYNFSQTSGQTTVYVAITE